MEYPFHPVRICTYKAKRIIINEQEGISFNNTYTLNIPHVNKLINSDNSNHINSLPKYEVRKF